MMVEAKQSYRERMKAERAEARAKRLAQEAKWREQMELMAEVRRWAREAVKTEIRARGDKITNYRYVEISAMADEMISAQLVQDARDRIAARRASVS
jgi:hypothetical protein